MDAFLLRPKGTSCLSLALQDPYVLCKRIQIEEERLVGRKVFKRVKSTILFVLEGRVYRLAVSVKMKDRVT